MTKQLDEKFENVKLFLKTKLNQIEWMSLTSDIWTDVLNTKSYICLTAHYVKDLSMESIIFAVKPLEIDHTSENIKMIIEDILLDWNLNKEKIVCTVTDGAASIVKAFHDMFGKNKHLHCFAHLLNLMVSDSFANSNAVADIISEIKGIVTFFKQSVKAADRLRNEQVKAEVPILKLKQEVKTRWNSTYYMLERFLTLNRFIVMVLAEMNGPQILGIIILL